MKNVTIVSMFLPEVKTLPQYPDVVGSHSGLNGAGPEHWKHLYKCSRLTVRISQGTVPVVFHLSLGKPSVPYLGLRTGTVSQDFFGGFFGFKNNIVRYLLCMRG